MSSPDQTNDTPVPHAPRTDDHFYVGRLIEHGISRHEHHSNGPPAYYVKILEEGGRQKTIWGGRSLQAAFQKSRTQPQLNELIGIREHVIDPVSAVYRARNEAGYVVAERRLDAPQPRWVVERLAFFDERAAAARALRDASLPRREATRIHRDLEGAYLVLDEGAKLAATAIRTPEGQARYLALLRETLARTIERGIPLPITEQRIQRAIATRDAAAGKPPAPSRSNGGFAQQRTSDHERQPE